MKYHRIVILLLIISCGSDPLQKNYYLDYSPMNEVYLLGPKENGSQRVKIPGHILFYGHNKDFIIANQKPTDSMYNSDNNLTLDKQQEMIFRLDVSKFWIITLKNDSIYGPLNKTEYFQARNFFKVPPKLKLDNSTQSFFTDGKRKDIQYYNPDSTVIAVRNLKGNSEKHNIKITK